MEQVECGKTSAEVAFFAGLSDDFGPVSQNTDLIFDAVITNVGSAYSTSTGRFTAPARATYQFTATVTADREGKAAANVLKNGVRMITVWANSIDRWSTSTNSVILSLEAGDQVWMQARCEASKINGDMYSSFSGFLLFKN